MGRLKTSRPRAASSTPPRNRWAWPCSITITTAGPIFWSPTIRNPTSLYRNLRNGTFEDVAVRAGVAFSEDGKARAGMGVDVADFDNSGRAGHRDHEFRQRNDRAVQAVEDGHYADVALESGVGKASRNSLGFGCVFFDADLDGRLDLLAVNGHIDETVRNIRSNVGYAQPPHLFLNRARAAFAMWLLKWVAISPRPKSGAGAAYGDFDRDGDVDLLITTNQGPAFLYRNDVTNGNRSLRLRLIGTKSNRDAIGAVVRLSTPDGTQSRMVKTGSSYLSQSELTVTFGLGKRDERGSPGDRMAERPGGRL